MWGGVCLRGNGDRLRDEVTLINRLNRTIKKSCCITEKKVDTLEISVESWGEGEVNF